MKGNFISSLVFAFLLTSAQPATAQEDLTRSIVGVWKITSFTRQEVGTGKISKRYGERPMGYTVFTPNGRFIAFAVAEGRKTPAKPDPSDTERIDLFNSMFAFSGTYKVEGKDKLVWQIDASWNQSWTGTETTRQAEIAGNKLTLIAPPFKSVLDGQDIVVSVSHERAE